MARVEIYTSLLCGPSHRAKQLLQRKGVAFEEHDIMLDPETRREMIARSGGRTSVPQVFVDGRHVGNCDELYALEESGALDAILAGPTSATESEPEAAR